MNILSSRHRHLRVAIGAFSTTMLLLAQATWGAATVDQKCQAGRYKAAAKYAVCQAKVLEKFYGWKPIDPNAASATCSTAYAAGLNALVMKFSGTGTACEVRYDLTSEGTVIDNLTGLQWEQKTDDSTVHDADNAYTWSTVLARTGTEADGSTFTDFLATLNSRPCFAGQCDWRLPSFAELQTIVDAAAPGCRSTGPCIDTAVFGPTALLYYFSSTTYVPLPFDVWAVNFGTGDRAEPLKTGALPVRAVRGGL